MLTVLSLIGTRPEAIKMAPVLRQLAASGQVRSIVCSTGQHRELLEQAFALFDLEPEVDLELMRPDQTLPDLTARLLTALDPLMERYRPDWVLAQGDTTTVLAGALVAFYRGIAFGHVEAGLRSGDLARPFPEELNRRVADQVARRRFAPTNQARQNLLAEGHAPETILVTGNPGIDAVRWIAEQPYDWAGGRLSSLPKDQRLVLVTAHRRESFGEPFRQLCLAIRELAETLGPTGVHFVYPIHLNPRIHEPIKELLRGVPHLTLTEPLDYASLVQLMKRAVLILTDSGGIQEEACEFRTPVLVLRETTERPEGVAAGLARVVGTSRQTIVEQATELLRNESARQAMTCGRNPYGDGQASARIVASLLGQSPTDFEG